jgi:hypothetical protein
VSASTEFAATNAIADPVSKDPSRTHAVEYLIIDPSFKDAV